MLRIEEGMFIIIVVGMVIDSMAGARVVGIRCAECVSS